MVGPETGDDRFRSYSGQVQLYNLRRVFKPIAIVCVHWLWAILRSVILSRHTFLVLILSPECVSPSKAVEMWG
jgi:hypothetical protein